MLEPTVRVISDGTAGSLCVHLGEQDISHLVQRVFWEAAPGSMAPSLTICLQPGAAAELAATGFQFLSAIEDLPA
ncbi:MAG: hypothetical protein ACRDRO_06370 [Pseudonocardiaceae bacterium]